jgi:hypothetical protein
MEKKSHPINKSTRQNGFTPKFYHIFNEELTAMLLKLFYKTKKQATLQNIFYEASITLAPKPKKNTKTTTKRKLLPNFPDKHT